MLLAEQTRSVLKPSVMASWFGGLSSSLGCDLGPMSHSVVSLTRHISRCTKDVRMMLYKTEESNELRRKEVETTKQSMRPKVERFMTFYSDIDLENKQETAAYNDLIKGDLQIKLSLGKEILESQKLENLQADTQSVTAAGGFIPATSSTTAAENIDPKASEHKHELEQKNLEMRILTDRYAAMYQKLLKLQKATESTGATSNLVSATPASISLGDNIDPNASEYEHKLKQQNLEMKILRGRNVAMKYKLLKLQKATQCLNVAAGLRPAMSLASVDKNIDPSVSEYTHELEQKNLKLKILRGRNVAVKHKLLKLRKATQCLNATAGLVPAVPVSTSLGNNIDNASEYKNQLEQQNLAKKILRGRNVAMNKKLLKLQKATEFLNAAAGILPTMSSASLGENIDPNASEYEHELEQKNLEVKILRGRNVAIKNTLLKLQKATEFLNEAAGLLPAMSSASLGENIDPSALEYEHELEQKNLEVKILRGRNVAMKHKLLKLGKATQCLNEAAGLVPAMPVLTSLVNNIDRNASDYKNELEQQNLEMKIQRGRNVAMKHKLLKLRKAVQCLNVAAGLVPGIPVSTSLVNNIDRNASDYKNQLEQQNLEMKIQRGRNVVTKRKLLKLQKATECVNVAAGLLPAMSSASLGENINPNASEYECELEQKNPDVRILRGRNVAMKHKLLKLRKAIQCLNVAAGLVPGIPVSTSLVNNIDRNASDYENKLEQQNMEMKIQKGRNVAMKHKLLKLQKATECLNAAASLLPATSSASLGENINPNASEYECELEQKNPDVKILRGRNVAMKHKLLKLQKATEYLNEVAGLLPVMSSASLGENIDPSASEYEHELKQKNLELKILRGRNVAMKHKLLKLRKATHCLNAAAGLVPAIPDVTPLGDNIDHNASEYKNPLEQQNLEMKILKGRNVAMKHKLLELQKATEYLNAAAGLLPAMSSASLGANIEQNVSEYEHEQKNLEVKILRGKNVAMKHKLLKLQKATQCLNGEVGLLPAMPASTSLGDNIDHNAPECKNELEMKILKGRNVAIKHKLLKLQKAIQCLSVAADLLPATSSASLGKNIDPNASEHELEEKNLEMKILRERHTAMKRKLLKLQNANQSINVPAGLIPAMSASTSLCDNMNPNASEYKHELELKSIKHHTFFIYQHLQNRMTQWIWNKMSPFSVETLYL
ncbi:uncharacterized protein LOC128627193 [Artibeus jamaicensis]|uniref:uncharacterized protein LOC128627193 n=1 Tax=Artibeus jamaicensis TaxID=9417 RepID=UPI00235A6E7F|nr:uncharacterized protein LOC128627193 [Artibeus jamaicensis]